MRSLFLFVSWTSLAWAQSPSDPCRNSIDFIASREVFQSDTASRVYKLCSGSYRITDVDYSMLSVNNGQNMVPLRSNLKIQCGDNGARENGCFIADGDILVDGTKNFGIGNERVDNVEIQGLTFSNAGRYAVWVNKPGSITFRDCEFRNMTDLVVPVFLDFFDGNNMASELSVTFENCLFQNNKFNFTHSYKPHNFALPTIPQMPSLVVAPGKQHRLTFDRTKFVDNDMSTNENFGSSYLIQTSGQVSVKNSCFIDNKITTAPILRYGKRPFELENNFGSTPSQCELFAGFSSISQFDRFVPQCIGRLNAARCEADGTAAPTQSPSAAPTSPTAAPSQAPSPLASETPTLSQSPTNNPTRTPSAQPSVSSAPSERTPSQSPSRLPTQIPSVSPSNVPTRSPSESPSFRPTGDPTISPSSSPTQAPSVSPSHSPTKVPSVAPSAGPTFSPSVSPTDEPTASPSSQPTSSPSSFPSSRPSGNPNTRSGAADGIGQSSALHQRIGFGTVLLLVLGTSLLVL